MARTIVPSELLQSTNNNIKIGDTALDSVDTTSPDTAADNIAIGNAAGYYIGPDDDYKFYLASHPIDESYICDNPNGANLTPLMYGDLSSNVLGLNTNSLHSNSTLQVGGNVSPSITNSFTFLNLFTYTILYFQGSRTRIRNGYGDQIEIEVGKELHL